MNKTVIIAASAAAAITIADLSFYASMDTPEVAFQYNNSASADFRLQEFVPAKGIAVEVRDVEKQVCGGVGMEDSVPQEVAYAYLDPKETVCIQLPETAQSSFWQKNRWGTAALPLNKT